MYRMEYYLPLKILFRFKKGKERNTDICDNMDCDNMEDN